MLVASASALSGHIHRLVTSDSCEQIAASNCPASTVLNLVSGGLKKLRVEALILGEMIKLLIII